MFGGSPVIETKKSYCRFCHAYCGILVDVEDDKVLAVRGDRDHEMTGGYTCTKGRHLVEHMYSPDRLRTSLKRQSDGSFEPIEIEQAMDEVAERVGEIIERDGPRSVAAFVGSGAHMNGSILPVVMAWQAAIESPSYYTPASIDQPGKFIAAAKHGVWGGGDQSFETADVFLFLGANPMVSMWSGLKFPAYNPWKRFNDAKKRGTKFIVIDPRKTELARRSDLHLQVRPGEDPTLLAGIINVMLSEGLEDGDFIVAHVEGIEELRESVKEFTPEYVEERAGVPAGLVREAAHVFAAGPRGMATSGTGASMAPRGALTEQLVMTLNTVCGRYAREGEQVGNPGVLTPPAPRRAQVLKGPLPWSDEGGSRVRGLPRLFGNQLPTPALADEILLEGEGQVKAFFSVGGNPVLSFPDQLKTIDAMEKLEISVALDYKLTPTARLSDYVIASPLYLERPDTTTLTDQWFTEPFAHYTSAMVNPPDGVRPEWEFFWGLAKRLGKQLNLAGGPIDMETKPSGDELLDLITKGSRVHLDEIRSKDGGSPFEDPGERVLPRDPQTSSKFAAGHEDVLRDLAEVRSEHFGEAGGYRGDDAYSHRLISRRHLELFNSTGQELAELRAELPINAAYMNELDLRGMGVESGSLIEITSNRASIRTVVQATDEVGPGVISMAHAWGDTPEHDDRVREIGGNTNRLITVERDYDPVSGIPMMTAIPVNVKAVEEIARR